MGKGISYLSLLANLDILRWKTYLGGKLLCERESSRK